MDKIVLTTTEVNNLLSLAKEREVFKGEFTLKVPFDEKVELLLEDTQQKMQLHALSTDPVELKVSLYATNFDTERLVYTAKTINSIIQPKSVIFNPIVKLDKLNVPSLLSDGEQLLNAFFIFCYVLVEYKELGFIETKEVTTLERKKSKPSKKKKGKPQQRIVRATHNRFYVNASKFEALDDTLRTKRNREWHIDEFTRRGHWRTYKSGRKVWIQPQTIKTGAKTQQKTDRIYKL